MRVGLVHKSLSISTQEAHEPDITKYEHRECPKSSNLVVGVHVFGEERPASVELLWRLGRCRPSHTAGTVAEEIDSSKHELAFDPLNVI